MRVARLQIDGDGGCRIDVADGRMAVAGDGVVAASALDVDPIPRRTIESRIDDECVVECGTPDTFDVDERIGTHRASAEIGDGRGCAEARGDGVRGAEIVTRLV